MLTDGVVISRRILHDFEDVDSQEDCRAGAYKLKNTHIAFLQHVIQCERCPSVAVQEWCLTTGVPLPLRFIKRFLAVDDAHLHLVSLHRPRRLQEVAWNRLSSNNTQVATLITENLVNSCHGFYICEWQFSQGNL
jgi:hypothetical protein